MIRSFVIVAAMGLSTALGGQGDPKPAAKFKLSDEQQSVLDETNAARKAMGLVPLKVSEKLCKVAAGHCDNMASKGELAHVLDGKGPAERLKDAGYRFVGCGENCAAGQRSPKEAVNTWMNSDGHRANILNARYVEIGIGVVAAADGTRYWTQVFATPGR
jgi:uncharacterized protein YkwD